MNKFETQLQELAVKWIHGKKVEPQIKAVLKDAVIESIYNGGGELATDNVYATWEVEENPVNVIGLEFEIKDFDDDWRNEIDLSDIISEIVRDCSEIESCNREQAYTERLMSY